MPHVSEKIDVFIQMHPCPTRLRPFGAAPCSPGASRGIPDPYTIKRSGPRPPPPFLRKSESNDITCSSLFGHQPQRGWNPVEHRGTFVRPSIRHSVRPPGPLRPEILSTQAWNLPSQAWNLPSQALNLWGQISDLREQNSGLKADSKFRGQISGLRG